MDFAGSLSFWGAVFLKLIIATVCGGVIGYERERYDRPAGFRTHVLVCVGAAVYMMVSMAVGGDKYDPGRIAAQVASGIGFLGAGTIIKQGSIVRGLTTAASLWAVAGIGLAAGYNLTTLAIALLGTVVVLGTLYLLRYIEYRMWHRQSLTLSITLRFPHKNAEWVRKVLGGEEIQVTSVTFPENISGPGEVTFLGYVTSREGFDRAINLLSDNEDVLGLHWEYR